MRGWARFVLIVLGICLSRAMYEEHTNRRDLCRVVFKPHAKGASCSQAPPICRKSGNGEGRIHLQHSFSRESRLLEGGGSSLKHQTLVALAMRILKNDVKEMNFATWGSRLRLPSLAPSSHKQNPTWIHRFNIYPCHHAIDREASDRPEPTNTLVTDCI